MFQHRGLPSGSVQQFDCEQSDTARYIDKAIERAMELAKSEAASYLPGWCGPHVDHSDDHG